MCSLSGQQQQQAEAHFCCCCFPLKTSVKAWLAFDGLINIAIFALSVHYSFFPTIGGWFFFVGVANLFLCHALLNADKKMRLSEVQKIIEGWLGIYGLHCLFFFALWILIPTALYMGIEK